MSCKFCLTAGINMDHRINGIGQAVYTCTSAWIEPGLERVHLTQSGLELGRVQPWSEAGLNRGWV